MKLPDKVYDVIKWIAVIFLPALSELISVILDAVHVDADVINGVTRIILAVGIFIGSTILVSTVNYNKTKTTKKKTKKDGDANE